MKKTYMVEFELPETLTEEFLALIPQQRYMINNLLADGTLKAYSLAMDRSKLWAVLSADSEIEAMEVVSQMPLADYMTPLLSELMFYNGAEMVLQFSLN